MSLTGKMGFMLQILGLDRFTKGKAAKGLAMAGKDQNPFDQGMVRVRSHFRFSSLFFPSSFIFSTRRADSPPPSSLVLVLVLVSQNCGDFWTAGGGLQVDYTQLYEIPNSGFDKRGMTSSMKMPSMSMGGGGGWGGGYEPVRTSLSEDV